MQLEIITSRSKGKMFKISVIYLSVFLCSQHVATACSIKRKKKKKNQFDVFASFVETEFSIEICQIFPGNKPNVYLIQLVSSPILNFHKGM